MKNTLILPILLIASLAAAQGGDSLSFHDDLLDHLTGKWAVAGTVHGKPSKQTLEAEWVLNHQFLRVYEKSVENVAAMKVPYEGVFFIGYDDSSNRYVAHLMNVFGGTRLRDSWSRAAPRERDKARFCD
jgi:hypothetical protein